MYANVGFFTLEKNIFGVSAKSSFDVDRRRVPKSKQKKRFLIWKVVHFTNKYQKHAIAKVCLTQIQVRIVLELEFLILDSKMLEI